MKRSSSRNTMLSGMARNQIKSSNFAWNIQIEPNHQDNIEEIKYFRELGLCCENSDVLETISKPQFHGDVILDMDVISRTNSDSEANDAPDSFFKSMKPALILAQCFGLFPVIGITGPNYRSLKFKWLEWRIVYGIFDLALLLFSFTCCSLESAKFNFAYKSSHWMIFAGIQIVTFCFLMQIARKWPKINEKFAEMESNSNKYGDPPKTNFKFKIITSMLMALVGAEWIMRNFAYSSRTEQCYEHDGFGSTFKTFMTNGAAYKVYFSRIPYSPWAAVLIIYIRILLYVIWSFRDLFLALISISLSLRLKQLNGVMFKKCGQEMSISFWRTIREDYNQLSILVTEIDSDIQKLMLLSIVENLYQIVTDVFIEIKTVHAHLYERTAFFLTWGLEITRISLVLFTAATIHDESKKTKKVLYSIPRNGYCLETIRFLTQLTTDEIALTGWGFFSVTRGLILTIIGTFVTYQILFLQFSKNLGYEEHTWPNFNKSDCV